VGQFVAYLMNGLVNMAPIVILPAMAWILGVVFKIGMKRSIRGAITAGIGLIGILLVADMVTGVLYPATQLLALRQGLPLTLVDVGWTDIAVAWSWPGALVVFAGIIFVNLFMLYTKLTKTMWTDIWSFWHGQAVAAFVWAGTGSVLLGCLAGIIYLALGTFASDITAKQYQEFNEMPGIAVPCSVSWIGVASIPLSRILMKIPIIKDINVSPKAITQRYSFLGEMVILGAVLGAILGVMAGYDIFNVFMLSMQVAVMLVLLPRMATIISEAFIPVAEAVTEFIREKSPNRELYIGVDCVVLLGHSSVMASSLILFPIIFILAIFLPGNSMLPFASLAIIPYWCGAVVPYTKGNVFHTVLIVLFWTVPVLLIATNLATLHTQTYQIMGLLSDKIGQGMKIASFDMGGDIIGWVIIKVLTSFR
jgi:galactitol PTS system EIIC component